MDSGKLLHGSKYYAKAQPMHRVREEVGSKEVREKEVMKEVGEVEVSEEALAEGLLHHLRRMKKPKDSLARVKDGLNNRLGMNPPSRQKASVQAGPECFNRFASEEVEREGPTLVPPDDSLIVPTPASSPHPAQPQAPAQAHQQLGRMFPDEEGSGEIRGKEIGKETGEGEASEEALADNLLHHLRRMKKPGVKPPSGQKGSVQARPGHFNLTALGGIEGEGPTSALPDDGLIIPTPPVSPHPAQAYQQLWRMSVDEEDPTNNSDKQDPAANSPLSLPSLPCHSVKPLLLPHTLMESGYSTPYPVTPRLPGNRVPITHQPAARFSLPTFKQFP